MTLLCQTCAQPLAAHEPPGVTLCATCTAHTHRMWTDLHDLAADLPAHKHGIRGAGPRTSTIGRAGTGTPAGVAAVDAHDLAARAIADIETAAAGYPRDHAGPYTGHVVSAIRRHHDAAWLTAQIRGALGPVRAVVIPHRDPDLATLRRKLAARADEAAEQWRPLPWFHDPVPGSAGRPVLALLLPDHPWRPSPRTLQQWAYGTSTQRPKLYVHDGTVRVGSVLRLVNTHPRNQRHADRDHQPAEFCATRD